MVNANFSRHLGKKSPLWYFHITSVKIDIHNDYLHTRFKNPYEASNLKNKFICTTAYVHYILIFNENNVLIRIFY